MKKKLFFWLALIATTPALASLNHLSNLLDRVTHNALPPALNPPTTTFAPQQQYAIIIDAGSTGSRLHLFRYINGNTPIIQDIFSESVEPGLSSFSAHPENAGASLKKLLDDALIQLQTRQIDPTHVPVTVLSTAGMRLLPAVTQQTINDNVTTYLRSHYVLAVQPAETISGKLEAVYGWLDINYLDQHFQNNTDTIGSIDVGGASVEIAFATQDTSQPNDEVSVHINNKTYTVFAKSFLGLGLQSAFATMNTDTNASTCYPSGYTDSHIATGNFNYVTCSIVYNNIIANNRVAEQILPHAGQQFVAYSGAYFSYKFFGLDKATDAATATARVQNVCNETWTQLHNEHPTDKYLLAVCANTTYVMNLLYNTYQIADSQLTVANQINQQNIDWTLGALLYTLTR